MRDSKRVHWVPGVSHAVEEEAKLPVLEKSYVSDLYLSMLTTRFRTPERVAVSKAAELFSICVIRRAHLTKVNLAKSGGELG